MNIEDEKNDFLFKNEDGFLKTDSFVEKSSSEKKEKLFTRIGNYFSNDQKNVKILLIFGVLAIFLGLWSMISNIKNAFVLSPIVLEDKSGVIENLNQLKDTDSDGISDYDEKYVYGTSPYLEDTDSDGISDYDEIVAGQAPLCVGETCEESSMEEIIEDENFLGNILGTEEKIMSLEELRATLIQLGYPAEEINSLSEENLQFIYDEAYNEALNQVSNSEDGLETSDIEENEYIPSAEELEQLQNLSIDQIKELLIQGGATSEQLDAVPDEELKSMYLEILQDL